MKIPLFFVSVATNKLIHLLFSKIVLIFLKCHMYSMRYSLIIVILQMEYFEEIAISETFFLVNKETISLLSRNSEN